MSKLSKVFHKLKTANFKIQITEFEFPKHKVSYLGHLITSEGVEPNHSGIYIYKPTHPTMTSNHN